MEFAAAGVAAIIYYSDVEDDAGMGKSDLWQPQSFADVPTPANRKISSSAIAPIKTIKSTISQFSGDFIKSKFKTRILSGLFRLISFPALNASGHDKEPQKHHHEN